MIKYENHLGIINISKDFFTNLVGSTVMNCFGVAGMAVTTSQKGVLGVFSKTLEYNKGIKVRSKPHGFVIDVHIIVRYGSNISAIVKSIIHKVTYTIEDVTGFHVHKVNVFVDSMIDE